MDGGKHLFLSRRLCSGTIDGQRSGDRDERGEKNAKHGWSKEEMDTLRGTGRNVF